MVGRLRFAAPRRTAGGLLTLGVVAILGAVLVLAGCGATSATAPYSNGTSHQAASGSFGGTASQSNAPALPNATAGAAGSSLSQTQPVTPGVYLIKALEVDMSVNDPRQTATDLQAWISTTDPRAVSAGANYQRQDDGTYQVQLTFSVEAALYPQVETYLASYAAQHKGHLDGLHETVQDVSSQYVDLQSRLTNLRGEQLRLQTLMAHASSLTDILAIEDRLTTVEGEIEQIEGQQTELAGQTTFYAVTLNLSPLSGGTATPAAGPWNPGAILHGAWSAALVFGQVLVDILIWLGVFAIYILPVVAIALVIRRLVRRRRARATPAQPATT